MNNKDEVKVIVPLDKETAAALRESAREGSRTMGREVAHIVRRTLARRIRARREELISRAAD